MKKYLLSIFTLILPFITFAQETTSQQIDRVFKDYTGWFVEAIFYEIPFSETYRIPWVLIVLIGGAIYFTLYFRFINFTGFRSALRVVQGKYEDIEKHGATELYGEDGIAQGQDLTKVDIEDHIEKIVQENGFDKKILLAKKGDVLITIENPEFVELQQAYLEIAEQLNYLKSEFNRQKTLYDENITSQKNFLKAESDYKSHLAQYNGLRKKMVMLNINPLTVGQGIITSSVNLYSPIDGFITEVNISNGKYVSPSDVIMKIINTEHIHLELSVFEKDILDIKKGQSIVFKIPEASQNYFEAEVHLVGTTIDETNRMVKVHAHIVDEEQANFIVGMFVEANIITYESKLLALPKDAILEHDDDDFTLVLKEKTNDSYTFEKIKINLNKENETHASVLNTNDITNKDVLIKGGFMLLNEGGGGGHSH